MGKRHVMAALLWILLMMSSAGFAADRYQWKLEGEEDGCRIYTSAVAGKEYIAAQATCVMSAPIEVIGMVLRDIAGYPQWMHDCTETKMLKVVDDSNDVFIFWLRQHVALLADRDMVLKSKTVNRMEKGRYLVYADSTNEISRDAGRGYVRMPSFHSLFTLEWMDREHTRVTFMIDPDLGKGVPLGIANSTIKANPLRTLKRMEKMATLERYVEAAKTSKYKSDAEDYAKAGRRQSVR